MTKPVIWMEGIIGAGKTELTKILCREMNFEGLYEPVEENPYLKMFYADMSKWAFPMQILLLHKRFALQKRAAYSSYVDGGPEGYIVDRGLPGDRVFAKLLTQQGHIEQIDWETYELAFNIMHQSMVPPTLLLYLDVHPDEAYQRARKRARDEESPMLDDAFREYLGELEREYLLLLEEIYEQKHQWARGMKICRIPWRNIDLDNPDPARIQAIVAKIRNALE
ncbi:MAG: deoxynucleoside kinase [Candidatus Thorarchaeota archaeon]|jgi:deoxyadenosine/deoxycytidine kinase